MKGDFCRLLCIFFSAEKIDWLSRIMLALEIQSFRYSKCTIYWRKRYFRLMIVAHLTKFVEHLCNMAVHLPLLEITRLQVSWSPAIGFYKVRQTSLGCVYKNGTPADEELGYITDDMTLILAVSRLLRCKATNPDQVTQKSYWLCPRPFVELRMNNTIWEGTRVVIILDNNFGSSSSDICNMYTLLLIVNLLAT